MKTQSRLYTEKDKKALLEHVTLETIEAGNWHLPVCMDIHTLMCVVGALQLALRHPANTGPSAIVIRQVVEKIIQRIEEEGYRAVAELMRMGASPEHDV